MSRTRRTRSIHRDNFKPGGLWDKYEAPPGGWGFAAAGFVLPDDLPATARNFGSFYNTHAHRFRWTDAKEESVHVRRWRWRIVRGMEEKADGHAGGEGEREGFGDDLCAWETRGGCVMCWRSGTVVGC